MSLATPIDDLLRWNDTTATRFHNFLKSHPEALAIPCDIRSSGDVAHLLQHIIAVELRYAQRLAGQPESPYEDVPFETPDALFRAHTIALDLLRPLVADDTFDWNAEIDFQTITMGKLRAKLRDVLLHLLLHSIRHYAQLSTLLRSHGLKPDWPMDFLFVNARRA